MWILGLKELNNQGACSLNEERKLTNIVGNYFLMYRKLNS